MAYTNTQTADGINVVTVPHRYRDGELTAFDSHTRTGKLRCQAGVSHNYRINQCEGVGNYLERRHHLNYGKDGNVVWEDEADKLFAYCHIHSAERREADIIRIAEERAAEYQRKAEASARRTAFLNKRDEQETLLRQLLTELKHASESEAPYDRIPGHIKATLDQLLATGLDTSFVTLAR